MTASVHPCSASNHSSSAPVPAEFLHSELLHSEPLPPGAWQKLCKRADLIAFSGVAAWLETPGSTAQIALFYLPGYASELYAIDHFDPFSGAYVIARGIVGDLNDQPVVASPIYKQHFRLNDGQCLEDDSVKLRTWHVVFHADDVWVKP